MFTRAIARDDSEVRGNVFALDVSFARKLSLSPSRPFPFPSCVSQIRGISTLQGVCLVHTEYLSLSSFSVFLSRDRNFRSKMGSNLDEKYLAPSPFQSFFFYVRRVRDNPSKNKNFPTLNVEYIKELRNIYIYTYILEQKRKEKLAIEKIFVSSARNHSLIVSPFSKKIKRNKKKESVKKNR